MEMDGGQVTTTTTKPEQIPQRDSVVKYGDSGTGLYKTLAEVLKLPTLLTSGTIDSSSKPNDIIYEIELSPDNLKSDISTTRIYYLAHLFKFWQGSIDFEMVATKAIFQQTKFIMAFFPGSTKADSAAISLADCVAQQHHVIYNPDNDKMVELNVPFWTSKTKHLLTEPTGLFTVRVFQPIVVTQETTTPLQWSLLVKTKDMDFYFAKTPGSAASNPIQANGVALGSVAGPQAPGSTTSEPVPVVSTVKATNTVQSQALVPTTLLETGPGKLINSVDENRPLVGETVEKPIVQYSQEISAQLLGVFDKVMDFNLLTPNSYYNDGVSSIFMCVTDSSSEAHSLGESDGSLSFTDNSSSLITFTAKGVMKSVYDPQMKENIFRFTHASGDTLPTTAQITIEGFATAGVSTNPIAIAKLESDLEELTEEETITHLSVLSPAPAAVFSDQLQTWATGGDMPPDMVLQHNTMYGANQDARAQRLVDVGSGLKFGFLGPIFDIVSSLPIVGDILKPITSVFEGANVNVEKSKLRADDFIVFDVAPGGNDVNYQYNSTVTAMTREERIAYRKEQIKIHSANNLKTIRERKVHLAMQYQLMLKKRNQTFSDAFGIKVKRRN